MSAAPSVGRRTRISPGPEKVNLHPHIIKGSPVLLHSLSKRLTQIHPIRDDARAVPAHDPQTLAHHCGRGLQPSRLRILVHGLRFLPLQLLEHAAADSTERISLVCALNAKRLERDLGERHLAGRNIHRRKRAKEVVAVIGVLEDKVHSADSRSLFDSAFAEVQSHGRRLVILGDIFKVHGLLLRAELVFDEAQLLVLLRRDEHKPVAAMQFALPRAFAAAVELFEDHQLAPVHTLLREGCWVRGVLVARFSQVELARETLVGALPHARFDAVGVVDNGPQVTPVAFVQLQVQYKSMLQREAKLARLFLPVDVLPGGSGRRVEPDHQVEIFVLAADGELGRVFLLGT